MKILADFGRVISHVDFAIILISPLSAFAVGDIHFGLSRVRRLLTLFHFNNTQLERQATHHFE
jgi:hypothetical protein